jgi:hypothetical protein
MREPTGCSTTTRTPEERPLDDMLDRMAEFYESTGRDDEPIAQTVSVIREHSTGLRHAGEMSVGRHGSSSSDQEQS